MHSVCAHARARVRVCVHVRAYMCMCVFRCKPIWVRMHKMVILGNVGCNPNHRYLGVRTIEYFLVDMLRITLIIGLDGQKSQRSISVSDRRWRGSMTRL